VTTLALVLAALAAIGFLLALWQRSEAVAARDRVATVKADLNEAVNARMGDNARHADEVTRLEAVIVDLRAEVKERDNEIDELLSDDPGAAGRRLARVLSDVPDPGDGGPGVPPSAGAGGGSGGGGGERG
jgi:hypothetical protein